MQFPEKVEKVVCLDIIRATPTIPATVDVRLRKTIGKLLKYEDAIISGPEQPISYESAVERWVSGTFGSLDDKACRILCKRGLRKFEDGYVFSRDRRVLAAPLAFIPKEDQVILARKVTADVLIIKFSEGPYYEPAENYREHVEALRTQSKCVRYVEMEGKHHTHLTHPELVAPIINDFLHFQSSV
jgi:pimeloyl-ACP methyl ester carboxylesterase